MRRPAASLACRLVVSFFGSAANSIFLSAGRSIGVSSNSSSGMGCWVSDSSETLSSLSTLLMLSRVVGAWTNLDEN